MHLFMQYDIVLSDLIRYYIVYATPQRDKFRVLSTEILQSKVYREV